MKQQIKQVKVANMKTRKRDSVKLTKNNIKSFKTEITQYLDTNGFLSWSAKKKKFVILGTNSPKDGLVECPECKSGELVIIKSHTTKKNSLGVPTITMVAKHRHHFCKKQWLKEQKSNVKFVHGLLYFLDLVENKNGKNNVQI